MRTSAHLPRKTFSRFLHVVLLVLKLGFVCFKNISQTHKRAVLKPVPVGDTVSKIILLSIYCLLRQNGEIFKILIARFNFAGIGPNQKRIRLPFLGKFLSICFYLTHQKVLWQ